MKSRKEKELESDPLAACNGSEEDDSSSESESEETVSATVHSMRVDSDFSILTIPSHLTGQELKALYLKTCGQLAFGAFFKENNESVIEKKIQDALKLKHPILPYLMEMSNEKLETLYSFASGQVLRKSVSKNTLCP